MKIFFAAVFSLAFVPALLAGEGVRYRGIFINDEDWSLRPWAIKHYGKRQQIGTRVYEDVFKLMKSDGLNLIWPAMHEGGYEFSERPENFALADKYGITVGTSHCEPMLRNNCYLPKADKAKWSWLKHPDFITDYWREGVKRGTGHNVMYTLGMRGIHDGKLADGKTTAEKKAVLESVFAAQTNLLASIRQFDNSPIRQFPTLFCPYKEVLPIYNAGLKVPDGTTIMWVNDNFGYIRRLGGPQQAGYGGGLYWHISYHGSPHGYIHLCTTPPAFMWYELCAKAWQNGVRDVWMLNVGDVFQAEMLLSCYGQLANDPDAFGPDCQEKLLTEALRRGGILPPRQEDVSNSTPTRQDAASTSLERRLVAHLAEYYNLGFIRKPEHMCVQWTTNLPVTVKADLARRYHAFLDEDLAIEKELASQPSTFNLQPSTYFRLIGFQAQFLAHAGIIHLEGKDRDYARSVIDPLYARWDKLEGGKWSGFWHDTIDEKGGMRQPTTSNRWSSQMQWPWNEPEDPFKKDKGKGICRAEYPATAYRANVPEPTWLEPVAAGTGVGAGAGETPALRGAGVGVRAGETPALRGPIVKDGGWYRVAGLGTSGKAFALLPVKPGAGVGATLTYDLGAVVGQDNPNTQTPEHPNTLVLQFLPDYALWPGLKLGVNVAFDMECGGEGAPAPKGGALTGGGGEGAPAPKGGALTGGASVPKGALTGGGGTLAPAGLLRYVQVPKSDSNLGEHDRVRNAAVQDNFIRVEVPVPAGAKGVRIIAVDPGVVIDRVGVR